MQFTCFSMAKLAVLNIFEGVLVLIHQTGITFITLAGFQLNKKQIKEHTFLILFTYFFLK